MKKVLVCVGLAVIGASTSRAQYNPGLTAAEMAQPYTVAATLRGFYDDNYLTAPNGLKRSTYGFEVSPQGSFNYNAGETSLNLNGVYDVKYYDDQEQVDQTVIANANLKHNFSELYSGNVSEAFIYSKEPSVLSPNAPVAYPLRTQGDNIHNDATIGGSAQLANKLSLTGSYANNLYAYQQLSDDVFHQTTPASIPSLSALLDRIEQTAALNLDWQATDELHGILGYQYEHVSYTSPEPIIFAPTVILSNRRNTDSHFVFVGADENFTDTLKGSLRVGAQYVDYYNAPNPTSTTDPYVDASLTWQYMADSSLTAGIKHQHNATDVVGAPTAGDKNPVLDATVTAPYVNVSQTIAGNLTANVLGQWQHTTFNGGNEDGKSEDFMILGLNFGYRFSPYLSAETGYNWNKLVSDLSGRDYTRNMVYVGVKGEY